jgi:gentisate 1,2-dioxygenase
LPKIRKENTVVEREIEQTREAEPQFSHYEYHMQRYTANLKEHREGKRVIKWKDIPWEQARQGTIKFYCSTATHDIAAPGWTVFQHRVVKHTGRHIHQGGLVIYAIDGEGYTVVDGVRFDWKKGDLLILPFKPGGVEHQHFNKRDDKPAHWVAFRFYPWMDYTAGSITQVVTHEDWQPGKQTGKVS